MSKQRPVELANQSLYSALCDFRDVLEMNRPEMSVTTRVRLSEEVLMFMGKLRECNRILLGG